MNRYVYVYLDTRKPGKYVYDDLEFEYEPFYVGQGKNNRCILGVKSGSNYKINKIKNIIDSGNEIRIIKLYENLNLEKSLELEMVVISKIGRSDLRKGPLVNLTDGGEWRPELSPNISTREKQSLKKIGGVPWNKGIPCKKEVREKISNSLKGDKHIYYGKKFSEEHRKKISESNKNVQIKPILQYSLSGEFIKEYNSILEASIENNINMSSIGKCCRCVVHFNTAGGFKWKFKYENGNHRKNNKIK